MLENFIRFVQRSGAPRLASFELITQREKWECGAAALGMVLDHYGDKLQIDALCRLTQTSKAQGVTMLNLMKAARSRGYEAKGYRYLTTSLIDQRKAINPPYIAWWQNSHFVVITSVNRRRVKLADPAKGCLSIAVSEFEASYSRVIMIVRPGGLPDRRVIAVADKERDLLKMLKREPSSIYRLNPRDFELVVAELLKDMGCDVEVTPQTRDGGARYIGLV